MKLLQLLLFLIFSVNYSDIVDPYYEFKNLVITNDRDIQRYTLTGILDVYLDDFYYFLIDYPCDDEVRDKFSKYLKNDSESKKRKTIYDFYNNRTVSYRKLNIMLMNYVSLKKKCYIFPSPDNRIMLYSDIVTCITMYTPRHICYKFVISDEEDNKYSMLDNEPEKYDIKLTYHINKYDKECTSKTGNVYINIIEPKKAATKYIIDLPFNDIIIFSIAIIVVFLLSILIKK